MGETGKPVHEMYEGKLKSGKSGKKVTDPKQAIAIGLSEACENGAKVPKKSNSKSASKKPSSKSPEKKFKPGFSPELISGSGGHIDLFRNRFFAPAT